MKPENLYLGHPPELVERAIIFPNGHFVQLDDMLFRQHGLGPRYAQIHTVEYHQHRSLSYAYWGLPNTTYDLITDLDDPQDLGSFEEMILRGAMVASLVTAFISRSHHQPEPQQLALALIRCRAENVREGDELGVHRVVKWALIYERRAHWITSHRQLAFAKSRIDWDALGL